MTVSKIATVVNGDVRRWWISALALFFFGTLVLRYDSAFELLKNKN